MMPTDTQKNCKSTLVWQVILVAAWCVGR